MAVHVLSVPDEQPPSPVAGVLQVPPSSFAPRIAEPEKPSPFLYVFKQMEVLHQKLLAAYEAEMEETEHSGVPELPELPPPKCLRQCCNPDRGSPLTESNDVLSMQKVNKTKSKTASAASLHIPGEVDGPVSKAASASLRSSGESENVSHNMSHASATGSAGGCVNKMSRRLMKRAREATVNMDCQIEADSLDSALQIREEWDLPEEKLLDLKRLQRRMSIGSMAGMQTAVTVKRQYLVKSTKEILPCYILHPNSYKRLIWDCLAMLVIMFETIISPLHLYRMENSFQATAEALQWVASGFWFLDIFASLFTAVYVNDFLRHRFIDIAANYLKSWCVFDLTMLTSDIVVLIMSETDVQAGVLRVARTRRLIRLLRLLRLIQIFRLWKVLQGFASVQNQLFLLKTKFGSVMQPVITLGLVMAFSVHVLGSLWFAVGDTEGGWAREEGLHETPLANQYIRSLEWAVSKLPPSSLKSTVELNNVGERWLGIVGTFTALIIGSVFISILTNTMAEVARERTRTTKILQSVRRYCSTYSISYGYTRQMKRYVEREHRRNEMRSHMSMLQTLPEGMVRELFQEGRSHTLHQHAFFKEIGLSDPGMELNLCSQAVSELYYLAGDVIFDTTSKVEGMYQMAAGQGIYFYWSDSAPPQNARFHGLFPDASGGNTGFPMIQTAIEARGYLAEAALWVMAWRHQGQLQALVESRTLMVSTGNLFKVLQGYANCMANTIVYARCFVQELNKNAKLCQQVTDLPFSLLPKGSEGARQNRENKKTNSLTSIFAPKRVQPERESDLS